MDIPQWAKAYLSPGDADAVLEAVKKAELTTSAELVPVIVRSSTDFSHVPMVLLLLGLFLSEVIYDSFFYMAYDLWIKYLVQIVFAFLFALILQPWPLIRRFFTTKSSLHSHVMSRAMGEFYESSIRSTEGHTGILIFVSLEEREAVVLADKAVNEKHNPQEWVDVIHLLTSGVRKQNLSQGLCDAIARCGEILTKDFPIRADDTNELPNHLTIKD